MAEIVVAFPLQFGCCNLTMSVIWMCDIYSRVVLDVLRVGRILALARQVRSMDFWMLVMPGRQLTQRWGRHVQRIPLAQPLGLHVW